MPLNSRALLVGLGAGLASALLIVSATKGAVGLRLLLSFLALQPGMLAGLGWGWPAAVVSGLIGSGAILALAGFREAITFGLTVGMPVAVLCYLAGLGRAVPAVVADSPAGTEWYPVGRITAAAALLAAGLAVAFVLFIAGDLEATRQNLRKLVEAVFGNSINEMIAMTRDGKPGVAKEEALTSITDWTLAALPAAAGVSWLASFLANLWLGAKVTQASGRLFRPWPDIAAMTYPRGLPLLLAAGLGATMLSEVPALFGAGIAGALLLAYALLGLCIVHHVTRGRTLRPMILGGLYSALLILNIWALLALAFVGLAEPFSPLRRRFGPAPPAT